MSKGQDANIPDDTKMKLADFVPPNWINYSNTGSRVILKPNAIDDIAVEIQALGASRLLIVCGGKTKTGPIYSKIMGVLGGLAVGVFDQVVEHSMTTLVTEGAALARSLDIDGVVAIGGSSASDTAKAIVILLAEGGKIEDHASTFTPPDRFFPKELHQPKLPVIAVPTTASAGEVTPGLGIRDPQGKKLLFWDIKLATRLIVLDPAANVSVPVSLMAATSMNAFAHCIEGLYSRMRNPISEGLALQGIRLLAQGIPAMVRDPESVDHRSAVLAGAHISGMVISNARVGIHHAMCHCLGALGGLSHGVANAIMLPHALAYNAPVAADQIALMTDAMGEDIRGLAADAAALKGIEAVKRLQLDAGVPTRLRDTGLEKVLLPEIARHTLNDRGLFFNPRRTESAAPILHILESAW